MEEGKNNLLRNKIGSMYIDLLIGIMILVTFVAVFVTMYPVFTLSQELNQTARMAARVVEVTGQVGDEVEEVLHNSHNMEPDTVEWITTYKNETERTIQHKGTFTVVLTKQVPITIIQPAFGEPLQITITLKADASGVSEVYWK